MLEEFWVKSNIFLFDTKLLFHVTYMPQKCCVEELLDWLVAKIFTFINIYVILVNIQNIIMTPEAERFNGWAAMLGFVAAIGAYVSTGQIIPGWF